jgi:hypothetical protein
MTALTPGVRRAYVFALHRARREGSLDGVLYVTEALAVMGDRAMVRKGFVIAEDLARVSGDRRARERVRTLEEAFGGDAPRASSVAAGLSGVPSAGDGSGSSHGSR